MLRTLLALSLAISFAPAAPRAQAWAAPERPWHEMEPRTTQRQLTLVSELAGHFWQYGDDLVHVHEIELVRHQDGTIAVLRAAFQTADGLVRRTETTLAEHPPGATPIHALEEITPGVRDLWWSDDTGVVHAMNLALDAPSPVGSGGEVRVNPGAFCTYTFSGYCIARDCFGYCATVAPCTCSGEGYCTEAVSASCTGRCALSNSCQVERRLGGCSCQ